MSSYDDIALSFPPRRPYWRELEPAYNPGRDEQIIGPLLSLILNEYSGGDRIPREGIPLTFRLCRKYGMRRASWRILREFVYPRRGYISPGRGGKPVVYLAHDRARRFVEKAFRVGKIGGAPHPLEAGPAPAIGGINTQRHTLTGA